MIQPTLFLGADHAGYQLKESIKSWLIKTGHIVKDLSPTFDKDDDYPAHGKRVANAVVKTTNGFGILVCGSGVGISIAANRVKGARAFDAYDEHITKLAREHTDANIITLSGWYTSNTQAHTLIGLFLRTQFSTEKRHARRVKQLG